MTPAEQRLADLLLQARASRRLIDPLPAELVPLDEASAYRVARRVETALQRPPGAWKIGATAPDNLRQLGAKQPIFGRIGLEDVHLSPCMLRFADLLTPVIECEFAFRLADGLPPRPRPWTADDLRDRIESLHPAIEVGDRRIARTGPLPIEVLIADASVAGKLVLGPAVPDWRMYDLATHAVALTVDGAIRRRGSGGEVMGHPLNALAWLANRLVEAGDPLRPGQIVSTGSCTGMTSVRRGERLAADFGPMGSVDLGFG